LPINTYTEKQGIGAHNDNGYVITSMYYMLFETLGDEEQVKFKKNRKAMGR
jgi:hypothetical protein